jgi:hypothetical protein
VRPGYASILVSRTRGAPLLRPATPSRFEPRDRPGDLADDMTIGGHLDATPQASAGPSQVERLPEPAAAQLHPWAADEQDEPLMSPRRPDENETDRRPGTAPPAPRMGRSRMPAERAAVAAAPEPTESADRHSPEPTGPVEQLVVTRRAEHQQLSAVGSHTPTEHDVVQPPIMVRIGRLEVRAVQPPPAPRAPARPQRHAGPTLEERLLARDRR